MKEVGILRSRGFTIVELLIVIVVIGILAALVIVAYNGIQQRANNTAKITAVKDYQTIINTYIRQYGALPYNSVACVGEPSNYTDWDSNGSLDCHRSLNTYHPNTSFITELKKISPNLPKYNSTQLGPASDGQYYAGISYLTGQTYDGRSDQAALFYWLEGASQSCQNAEIANTYNVAGTNVTFCVAKLLNPATL